MRKMNKDERLVGIFAVAWIAYMVIMAVLTYLMEGGN